MSSRFVGRKRELDQLLSGLAQAQEGRARFAAVEGEPGIGKTRLLRELSDRASDQGCLVLHGRAAEFERELPFGLFVDALDSYLEAAPASAFSTLPPELIDELASAFPAMRPLATGTTQAPAPDDRVRVHRAVRELIGGLAPGKAILITLDDLQWSDRASLELVGHLMRRPPRAGVLIAFSYRTRRLDSAVMTEIAAAEELDTLGMVRLAPLGRDDAAALVGGDGSNGDSLYEDSGGNPFYLLELARLEQSHGEDGRGGGAPHAVGLAISRELEALSEDGRSLVNASAVVGDPFSLDLSMRAAGLDSDSGLDALDRLVSIGPRAPHRRAAALPVPPPARSRGDLRLGPARNPPRHPRRLRRPAPRRQRRARRACAPRGAGGTARRRRGDRAAPGRCPRVGGPRAGQRRGVAALGSTTAPRRRRPRRPPGAVAAAAGTADLARRFSRRLRGHRPGARDRRRGPGRPAGGPDDRLRLLRAGSRPTRPGRASAWTARSPPRRRSRRSASRC